MLLVWPFVRQDELLLPGARMVDRERLDGFVGRERPEQDQASFGGGMFGVNAPRRLQAVDALFGGLRRGAHPNPVVDVVLVGFEQAGEQVFGARAVARLQGFHRFLEQGVYFIGHNRIVSDEAAAKRNRTCIAPESESTGRRKVKE